MSTPQRVAAVAAQFLAVQLALGGPLENDTSVALPSTVEPAESVLEVPGVASVFSLVVTHLDKDGQSISTTRGTAFAYEADGESCVLMTALHVVQDAGEISVYPWRADLSLGSGHEALVRWSDTKKDLAALTIKRTANCKPATRSAGPVPIGRRVFTYLNSPQSRGMVKSGIVGGYWITNIGPTVVCDLQVYPGQSGSPVIDVNGNLIGMVVSRTLSSEVLGAYAVPASQIDAEARLRGRTVTSPRSSDQPYLNERDF